MRASLYFNLFIQAIWLQEKKRTHIVCRFPRGYSFVSNRDAAFSLLPRHFFPSRVWLQCSRQGCCPKVKDQSFLLFINGVETAKIQSAAYPLSLNHPPRRPSSFRCVPSDPTTSRQLLSQRIFTCSFFSESLCDSFSLD